jgi:hypothetical protein
VQGVVRRSANWEILKSEEQIHRGGAEKEQGFLPQINADSRGLTSSGELGKVKVSFFLIRADTR